MTEVRMTVIRRKDTGEFLMNKSWSKSKKIVWTAEFYSAMLHSTGGAQKLLKEARNTLIPLEAVSVKLSLEGVKEI